MRKYILYIVCTLCVLGLGGCIASDTHERFNKDGEVTLTLSLGDHTRTNTPDNGVGEGTNDDDTDLALNENKIATLEVYLYPTGAENEDAVYATRVEGLDKRDKVENITFSIPAGSLNTLFAGGTTRCGIYVIANYDTGRTVAVDGVYANTSIAELKAIEVSASFDALQQIDLASLDSNYSGSVQSIKPQQLFVMDSELSTVTKSGNNLSGTVYITRAASKITFRTTIAQSLEIDGKTWVPMLEHLSFTYKNIVNKGYIDNGSDVDTNNSFPMPSGQGVYADTSGLQMSSIFSDHGAKAPNYDGEVEGVTGWTTVDHIVPLYTYSSRWSDGANNEAYIMLSVPWKVLGDTSETLTYYNYFVPINMNDLKLVRNKHYRINLRVGVLGDLEELTESEFSYEVLDWVGENIEVKLQKPTYLVVDSNYVVMKNIEEFSVGYQSSDEVLCEVLSTTISSWKTQNDVVVSGSSFKDFYLNGVSMTSTTFKGKTVSAPDGIVTFTHGLDNTRSDTDTDYDFYVQTTVVRIYHKNNPSIYEDITFVQYPAMYVTVNAGIEGKWNYINVNGNGWENWTTSKGAGTGCPKYPNNRGTTVYWVGIGGKTQDETIHNMYQITVTAFDATTANYIVADPRAEATDITTFPGYNNGNSSQAPDYPVQPDQLGVTTIKGYRGTLVENSDNLVAPEFIVASHCSTCTNADQYFYSADSGYNRCAGYQEAGYPAGRWRLPTTAELEVVGKLCAQKKLPQIFVDGVAYISASGTFLNSGGNFSPSTTKQAQSVRCVYDTWYWKDKCNDTSMKQLLWGADGNVADMKADGTYDTYLERVK